MLTLYTDICVHVSPRAVRPEKVTSYLCVHTHTCTSIIFMMYMLVYWRIRRRGYVTSSPMSNVLIMILLCFSPLRFGLVKGPSFLVEEVMSLLRSAHFNAESFRQHVCMYNTASKRFDSVSRTVPQHPNIEILAWAWRRDRW